jgi:hypothetical protein
MPTNAAPAERKRPSDLLPYQLAELAHYAGGKPRHVAQEQRVTSPTANLIRRNLLMKVGGHGDGLYAITEAGRAALRETRP